MKGELRQQLESYAEGFNVDLMHQGDQKVERYTNINRVTWATAPPRSEDVSHSIPVYVPHPATPIPTAHPQKHASLTFTSSHWCLSVWASELDLKVRECRHYNVLLVAPLSLTWPWVLLAEQGVSVEWVWLSSLHDEQIHCVRMVKKSLTTLMTKTAKCIAPNAEPILVSKNAFRKEPAQTPAPGQTAVA